MARRNHTELNGLAPILSASWRPDAALRAVLLRQVQDSLAAVRRSIFVLQMAMLLSAAPQITAAPPASIPPATFRQKTQEAFAKYVRATDERNRIELQNGKPLLWLDALPENDRTVAYAKLKQGEVQMEQRKSLKDGEEIPCPGGMIHHWEGVVFIPDVHVDDVLRTLEDYNQHFRYYAPDVERSRIESRDGDHFRVFLRFRRHKVITVVLNTEHEVQYFRDSQTLAHSRSSATHIGEVENSGKPDEREKTAGDDGGFLWGMETWWRLEERDGGVYLQSEVVSLTRDIPTGLGWMIGPFVTSIPKETLSFTLLATRNAVLAQSKSARSK